jgi:HPt (histidine-containing phosphotransfer) domain-containing protein
VNEPLTVPIDKEIIDLAEIFLRNRREQAAQARNAVATGDLVTLRRIGHELKGTAGSFGFKRLSAIGASLESAAAAGDLTGCGEAVSDISEYLARVTISPC